MERWKLSRIRTIKCCELFLQHNVSEQRLSFVARGLLIDTIFQQLVKLRVIGVDGVLPGLISRLEHDRNAFPSLSPTLNTLHVRVIG